MVLGLWLIQIKSEPENVFGCLQAHFIYAYKKSLFVYIISEKKLCYFLYQQKMHNCLQIKNRAYNMFYMQFKLWIFDKTSSNDMKHSLFLVACTRLYKSLCRSVGRSVGWLVGWSVGWSHFTFLAFLSSLRVD